MAWRTTRQFTRRKILISAQVVAIDAEDRWAPELNDVEDVERLIPGTISLIREWFRTYKIPDGKPPNKFALDEKCMGAKYAHKVIHETHTFRSVRKSNLRFVLNRSVDLHAIDATPA